MSVALVRRVSASAAEDAERAYRQGRARVECKRSGKCLGGNCERSAEALESLAECCALVWRYCTPQHAGWGLRGGRSRLCDFRGGGLWDILELGSGGIPPRGPSPWVSLPRVCGSCSGSRQRRSNRHHACGREHSSSGYLWVCWPTRYGLGSHGGGAIIRFLGRMDEKVKTRGLTRAMLPPLPTEGPALVWAMTRPMHEARGVVGTRRTKVLKRTVGLMRGVDQHMATMRRSYLPRWIAFGLAVAALLDIVLGGLAFLILGAWTTAPASHITMVAGSVSQQILSLVLAIGIIRWSYLPSPWESSDLAVEGSRGQDRASGSARLHMVTTSLTVGAIVLAIGLALASFGAGLRCHPRAYCVSPSTQILLCALALTLVVMAGFSPSASLRSPVGRWWSRARWWLCGVGLGINLTLAIGVGVSFLDQTGVLSNSDRYAAGRALAFGGFSLGVVLFALGVAGFACRMRQSSSGSLPACFGPA